MKVRTIDNDEFSRLNSLKHRKVVLQLAALENKAEMRYYKSFVGSSVF